MYVDSLTIENIRCFENQTINFRGARWVTLLGPNGCGKSTVLQSLALLLAGPEGAQKLLQRPVGWLRNEAVRGRLGVTVHQSDDDPGKFGTKKVTKSFTYSFSLVGNKQLRVNNKLYTEPGIVENPQRVMSWLRQNALTSTGKGWFAVGYGAFRRLTRKSQIVVPSLEPQARYTNFFTQFFEDEPLSAFEQWMVYLDYRIAKSAGDKEAKRQRDLGVKAINSLLPDGMQFDHVSPEGRILFNVQGSEVPTISLSDGYRSVLALSGDLVWRLIQAFPETTDPLSEAGVVLIDELDIHLHPLWQRDIALLLQKQFPNLQFIVATHSPLIASGAGESATTLRFTLTGSKAVVNRVESISAKSVDYILRSEAFGLISPYSPQTQDKIDRYDSLVAKRGKLNQHERADLEQLQLFVQDARPFGGPKDPGSLEAKIDDYLEKAL
ncbi:MAG: AAA family ATPase [Terracidiphilus sp.]|jgi:energy-coupling factor transporter ATP-binding protein EcfA2